MHACTVIMAGNLGWYNYSARVSLTDTIGNTEVGWLGNVPYGWKILRFSWVADDTKIIHVEGGINTRENV